MISQGDSMVSSDWKVSGIDMHCFLNCERGEKLQATLALDHLSACLREKALTRRRKSGLGSSAAPQLGAVMEKLEAECATSR